MAKNQPKTVEEVRADIANINRTSDVAQADYVYTLLQYAPEKLDDIVDPDTVGMIENAIAKAGDHFTSSTEAAVQKTINTKVEAAVRALTNDAELTGYAGRVFNAETFAKKVAPKEGRKRLSPQDKAARVVEDASPEQLEALAALLKERGISIEA